MGSIGMRVLLLALMVSSNVTAMGVGYVSTNGRLKAKSVEYGSPFSICPKLTAI